MLPQVIGGRFRVERVAASGGMGTVYRGHDETTGRAVAIKVLRRAGVEDLERFRREATILAELQHPGIVPYIDHGNLDDGSPYLVMAWLEGETLDARLHGAGLSIGDSIRIARRVADALGFAHARGLVHRDVKPSNLIFPDGDLSRTMVIDFGLARPAGTEGSLTETGTVIGTPSYMAPEQVRGDRVVTSAADVFSLGCVLYESLTGRLTFEGARFLALRAKILLWDPPWAKDLAPGIPEELDQLVRAMIAKRAEDRPQNGSEVAARLAALPLDLEEPGPRRARQADLPTARIHAKSSVHVGGVRTVTIVVATPPDGIDASAAPTMTPVPALPTTSMMAKLAELGARVDSFPDGALIATLAGCDDTHEQARCAADAARVIRDAMPEALIGIGTADASREEEAGLIDEVVQALGKDAMKMLFSGVSGSALPAGCIRLDDRTASLLDDAVKIGGAHYLERA